MYWLKTDLHKKVALNVVCATASFICLFPAARAQDAKKEPLLVRVNTADVAQTIHSIGASGCWYSEGIGKHWPAEKKERIAELLFSKKPDQWGNPAGIGLSAFRFNIGGGTAEQGEAGGIRDPNRRVECFLNPDGTYDWNKQSGYQWFLRQAKAYGVEHLIAFSNTPPVQFTANGLGFKTTKDEAANLKPGYYAAYAGFLATVIRHFDEAGLHFSYVSPVNEPQWDWSGTVGTAKQEGTPWTNREIHRVIQALDSAITANRLKTEVSVPEAAMLNFLYGDKTASSRQIQTLFSEKSDLSVARFKTVPRIVAGHSYFSDTNDSTLVHTRKTLADTARKYKVAYWQSEYSMLGNGYREGARGRRTPMDCALFLAKVIHADLAIANATAWHLWNAYEPGTAEYDTRYYLLALKPDPGFADGSYTVTKNLWSLGHYSLFVRPGMQRLHLKRSDNMSDLEAAQQVMVSAYKDGKGKVVVVAINYAMEDRPLQLDLSNARQIKSVKTYVTTASEKDNMRAAGVKSIREGFMLPARSITTIVAQ